MSRPILRPVLRASGLFLGAVFFVSGQALAQTPGAGRVEVSGGLRMIGSIPFASVPSEQTTRGGTSTLFRTSTDLDRSFGPLLTVGVRFARILRAEAAFGYNNARLVTRITGDTEGGADTTAHAPVRQFLMEAGLLVEAPALRTGPMVPFASGGAGYLRQLYDGRTLVETGHASYFGGGVFLEHTPARAGVVKATGLRVDVRAMRLRDGVISDGITHWAPAVAAQAFARF